ncbi:PREDICTED: uncharacterized protein LOC109588633 [Amphimedon queenslandica]|uniref:Death domain-containing protein n=1 Tax=Amphimedon queenslandica TaxID=400682 RepID=A0A1X7TCV4_AMPQE|nr:PREDICTED: uncharacterized protein LOC109588633 [Amphimedon queenslandica]|eukprot:XP_019860337.1 PREDICTED: uncharacterized protein LOC109588633 [Amphimedon queenslandica]
MFQESQISCIIHQAVEIQSQSSEVPIKFIIACSDKDTKGHRDEAKRLLLKAINKETARLSEPLQVSVLVLDPSSSDDMKKLNIALDMNLPLARRYIKLSWLFLRDALNDIDEIVIPYNKLKEIAGKLNIQEMELKEFLETFTKFMSILYLPGIKSLENVVILRPVEFINTMSSLFKTPDDRDFDGVYTMDQLNKMIPNKKLADTVTKALCSVGLAIKTTIDKVNIRTSELKNPKAPLLFVPLARSGQVLEKCHVTSLFIVFNSKVIQPDCQSFFISELLKLAGSSLQSGSDYHYHLNVFKILLVILRQDYYFSIIFRGTSIDVVMENYGDSNDVFKTIIICCKEALSKMSSIRKNFSYKLALSCLTPRPTFHAADDYIDPAKRIFDYLLPNTKLCYHCERSDSPLRKKWKDAIQKIHENEEKRKERVNVEKLIELAQSLGSVIKSTQTLKNLAAQLRVRVEQEYIVVLSKSCLPWQRVLMILLMWEKKEEATKETLKDVLIRLGYPTVLLD